MAQWNTYRMWYRRAHGVANRGSSGFWFSEWKPGDHLFRARSPEEAMRKADKLWRDCQFGMGSVTVALADEDIRQHAA